MSRARDYRRNKDGRAEDRFAERRRRFKPIMRALGLEETFNRMHRRLQEFFWARKFPDPQLIYDEGVPAEVRRSVERSIRERTIEIDGIDGSKVKVPARDILTSLVGLKVCIENTRSHGMPPAVIAFLERARPVLNKAWDDSHADAFYNLIRHADWEVVAYTRLDSRVMWTTFDWVKLANHKTQIRLHVRCGAPQRVRASLADGNVRPVYRVWRCALPDGLKWISWSAAEVGLGGEAEWPVYVQTHALKQLHERLDMPKEDQGCIEHYMATSLEQPNVVERQRGGDLLVEFRLVNHRVGYLVVTPSEGRLIVRTFLLLTMLGTPEGDRFYDRFRLSRDEAAWLRLHQLSSFTKTDLRNDLELRTMLAECGCGALLEMRMDSDVSPLVDGYAADLRKFLRIPATAGSGESGVDEGIGAGDEEELRLREAA
jgi:hypothetical protein